MSYSKEELVKTGKIDREDGILFNRLFAIRQQADYEDFVEIRDDNILPLVPKIKALIQGIENIIDEDHRR
ncbi:MAG: hypothetical protein H6575_02270 [Lewinellaceae bacterium]|nr:hypothetical protein [Lewinellaceae bacterium]